MAHQVVDCFKLLPPQHHSPRITIDRLVISRETWRFSPSKLSFLCDESEAGRAMATRFMAIRRWAREQCIPRFVFIKVPVEEKPVYLDLDSPISIDVFSRIVRRTAAQGTDDESIQVVEMLPDPEHVWLPDAAGQRYTSELRFVAVDQKPLMAEPFAGSWAAAEILAEQPDDLAEQLAILLASQQRGAPPGPPLDGTPERHVHRLFEAQVARCPDAIAVVWGEVCLTYTELNRRANQLAHHLRALGVGPDVPVGLHVERSPEMMIGILGVLKAGGVYVPLDPAYPRERLAFMLEDAQVSVLLTSKEIGDWKPAPPLSHLQSPSVIDLVADWELITREPAENLEGGATAENLAYIIYTSGSTGQPKGVMIRHAAVAHYIAAANAIFSMHSGDRVLQFASVSFDAAVEEMFLALSSGAALLLRTDAMLGSLGLFLQHCDMLGLTVLDLPTAYWHLLVDALATEHLALPSCVRLVIIGGEAVRSDRLALWRQHVNSRVRLVNSYGPTETTIVATTWEVTPTPSAGAPIGTPIAGLQGYILDQSYQPVQPGEPGELYIGGAGLARGYLGRPDLTAERFIPCPWSVVSGQLQRTTDNGPLTTDNRLYRTGDLARFLPDGTIEYLGRADDQVKVRGFRIELGEIEAALRRHPQVREAVVLAREDTPGQRRLVAYLVPGQEQRTKNKEQKSETPDSQFSILNSQFSGELRAFLKQRLPEYMLPSAFIILQALPRTVNGKVDRGALPRPDNAARPDGTALDAARTSIEEQLVAIWSEVFDLQQIGIHETFFDLGGHSLAAIQIVSRVRDVFQLELPVHQLFDTPDIARLARLIEQQLIGAQQAQLPPIRRVSRDGPLPLSSSQERVVFLNQLVPDSIAYHAYVTVRFKGELNIPALKRALAEIVRRQEILRTSFGVENGNGFQRIQPPYPIVLPVVDLSQLAEAQREAVAAHLTFAECRQPFDITHIPLIRWALLRLASDDHIFIQVEHHLLHDGWSLARLLKELSALYEANLNGRTAQLPEPAFQFADFAAWQRRWMSEPMAQQQLAYWQRRLAGSPALLNLPTDRPRPAMQTFDGWVQRVTIGAPLGKALRALSRREGTTLFMTMLAAFAVLLYHSTAQTDILIGTAVANRRLREIESVLGMIVNNIVLRTALAGNLRFRELLAQVRGVTLEAYAHQDLPFEKVVEALRPQRDLSYNPLFQVMFSFHDSAMPLMHFPGLTGEILYPHNGSAKFDLNIVAMPQAEQQIGLHRETPDDRIMMEWEYNTSLFDDQTITRMVEHYLILLEGIVADPDRPIAGLPLLADAERRQVLEGWNDTRIVYPDDRLLHTLFEAQAANTPHTVAAVFANQHVTYGELNWRANQLAHELRALGVGPEVPVGVCAERSLELVVGLLGVLKAGGAYVALDPSYPPNRLAFMLEDALVSVLLTNKEMRDWRLEINGSEQSPISNLQSPFVIDLVADWEAIAQQPAHNPDSALSPDNLAYIIYTSGSTGRPKGAMNTHRGIVNRLLWMQATYRLSMEDRVVQKTPFSFDVSVWEFFWPLMTGACLVLAQPDGHQDSAYLADLIATQRISTLHFVPSMLQLFLEEPNITACRDIKRVICSGEALPGSLQRRFFACLDAELHNLYGPTEAAIDVSSWECSVTDTRSSVPIGHPIANTQLYVLDPYVQPVPIGVAGELYIGGVQLARGYLHRPDLTAERFVPNPFTTTDDPFDTAQGRRRSTTDLNDKVTRRQGDKVMESSEAITPSPLHPFTLSEQSVGGGRWSVVGGRLYRTGDLARFLPDGSIEFLGRIDQQIKLRGFRIELGEIETALALHPLVREAVVLARNPDVGRGEDVAGERRLVAYLVPATEDGGWKIEDGQTGAPEMPSSILHPPSSILGELRAFLKERLPDYMIPATFVWLETFPLTPSGKVDRRALPAPEADRPDLEEQFVAPRTPTEQALERIWVEVLRLERVGVYDNFFDLGGHSLLAARVLARVRQVFEVDMPLRSLFEAPTIAAFADALTEALLREIEQLSEDEVQQFVKANDQR